MQVDDVEFVVAGGEATESFEPVEKAFDQIALAVGVAVERPAMGGMPVRMRRRDQFPAQRSRAALSRSALVGAVGDQLRPAGLRAQPLEQLPAPGRVARLTRRQRHHQWYPIVAHDRVQLGSQSAV